MYRVLTTLSISIVVVLCSSGHAALPAGAQSSAPATAATGTAAPETPPGIVLLVRRTQHIRAAIQTANDLADTEPLRNTPVEIVVCGQAISALQGGSDLSARIVDATSKRVQFIACGMSIENHGIDPNTLPDAIDTVPNGLVHALERQARGYLSVEL